MPYAHLSENAKHGKARVRKTYWCGSVQGTTHGIFTAPGLLCTIREVLDPILIYLRVSHPVRCGAIAPCTLGRYTLIIVGLFIQIAPTAQLRYLWEPCDYPICKCFSRTCLAFNMEWIRTSEITWRLNRGKIWVELNPHLFVGDSGFSDEERKNINRR